MRTVVHLVFTDMKLFLILVTSYISILGIFQFLVIRTKTSLIPVETVLFSAFILYYVSSQFDKFMRFHWMTKLFSLMYFIMVVYGLATLFVFLFVVTWNVPFFSTLMQMFILSIFYFIFSLYLLSRFDTIPIFRSDFEVDDEVEYPVVIPWILFTVVSALFVPIIAFILEQNVYAIVTSEIMLLLVYLPVLFVLNEVVWQPKDGTARLKPLNPETGGECNRDDPYSVIRCYRSRHMGYKEHIDLLYSLRESVIRERDDMKKFLVVNHLIDSARYEGAEGREAKILIFMLLPLLLERWRIFALLPKHLQRLAYKFLELLYLLDEMTPQWENIMNHEVKKRVSSKYRFAMYWNSPLRPRQGLNEWVLAWDHLYYIGEPGFEKAKEKYLQIRENGLDYQPEQRFDEEWVRDLETSTLNVFSTFFGVGSRTAWGGSVQKGSYDIHRFVVAGNYLSAYSDYKEKRRETVLKASDFEAPKVEKHEELDSSYIKTFIERGVFPPVKLRSPEDERKKRPSVLQKLKRQKYNIGFFTLISILSFFFRDTTSTSGLMVVLFFYIFVNSSPKVQSYVREEDPVIFTIRPYSDVDKDLREMEDTFANFKVLAMGLVTFAIVYWNGVVN